MGKVRVYELAKELHIGNKELVQKLQQMGYPIKSHSSTIEEFQVKEIMERLKKGQAVQEPAPGQGRPTVIRRRKKLVPPPVDDVPPPAPQAIPEDIVPIKRAAKMEPTPVPPVSVEPPPFVEAPPAAEPPRAEEAPVEDTAVVVAEAPVEEAAAGGPEPVPVPESEPETATMEAAPEEPGAEVAVESPAEAEAPAVEAAATAEPAAAEAPSETPVETVEPAEAEAKEEEAAVSVRPKSEPEVKVKKIEKVTVEPARIISRPKVVEPPQPAARNKPPVAAAPVKPRRETIPVQPEVEPEAIAPSPPTEGRRSKKKKRGRDQAQGAGDVSQKRPARRREIIERSDLYDIDGRDRPSRGRKGSKGAKKVKKTEITVPKAIKRRVKVTDAILVSELAKRMGIKATDVVKQLMSLGVMVGQNQAIDLDTATLVAAEFGYEVEKGAFDEETMLQVVNKDMSEKAPRPPVVTVMGHVDHGKTSLLDAIRKTDVIKGEAGGITQHIGAYHVEVEGGRITFLDTPGHEAFTAMRARGAQVTDIVVLLVAADDGVMQQTREAADHARAAGVPIIVAVNKIDKPEADRERIRREVSNLGLVPEEWGGDTIFADVSAKTGEGVSELLDMILLQSEVLELKSSPDGRATGHIIEARLDKGRGPVATVLVQDGRLKQGDPFVCGVYSGKIRAMFDDLGNRVDEAGPSVPVEIQGIGGVPQAGDEFVVVEDEKQAKQISQHRQLKQRESELIKTSKLTLETLFDSIKEGAVKELNVVLKADVQGSLEAIADALTKLATEDIKVNIIHSSTGAISETDIMLASASEALVVGFNVRPNAKVQDLADYENIQIRFYDVIYKLIDDIKEAMAGLLEPIQEERVLGRAEVRQAFHVSKVGTIAGSAVLDGKVVRGARARLLRDDVVIYTGRITSLRRFKDDAKEVLSGYECGIGLENYDDIKAGDIVEAYDIQEVAATLD